MIFKTALFLTSFLIVIHFEPTIGKVKSKSSVYDKIDYSGTYNLVEMKCSDQEGYWNTTKKAHKNSEKIIINDNKAIFEYKSPDCSYSKNSNFEYKRFSGGFILTNIKYSYQAMECSYQPQLYESSGKIIDLFPTRTRDGNEYDYEEYRGFFIDENRNNLYVLNKYRTIKGNREDNGSACYSHFQKEQTKLKFF